MDMLALVPTWFWVALGTIVGLGGLVAGVWWSRDRRYRSEHLGLWRVREWLALADPRRWRYSRQQAAHVLRVTEAERPEQFFYGSMLLAEEHKVHHDFLPSLPAMPVWYGDVKADPVPWEDVQSDARIEGVWLAQTAAALSPEALDSDVQPDPYIDAIAAEHVTEFDPYDSGPGAGSSSSPPGPDPIVLHMDAPPFEGPQLFNPIPARVEPCDWNERLADTGDIQDARLLADAEAFMRQHDAETKEYLAGWDAWCAQYQFDLMADLNSRALAEALA